MMILKKTKHRQHREAMERLKNCFPQNYRLRTTDPEDEIGQYIIQQRNGWLSWTTIAWSRDDVLDWWYGNLSPQSWIVESEAVAEEITAFLPQATFILG